MAKNEIRYDVKVDSSDAQRGLRDFSRAAQDAGKDAARSLEDTATAGDKAREAIKTMAQAFDTELRDAAAASDALKASLGEVADRFDTDQIVADLSRMGVSFDDIRGEADQFATTLKQVDDIRLQQTADGIDRMKGNLEGVRGEADQSRSVLANLAGNTAQSFGELGGVVGDLGVGLGQLVEYAVDGNIALGNLAAVAGPMAALVAASALVSQYIGEAGAEAQAATERTNTYRDAIEELGTGSDATAAALQKMAADIKPDAPGLLDKLGVAAGNLAEDMVNLFTLREQTGGFKDTATAIDNLDKMGFSFESISPLITGSKASLDAFIASLEYLPEAEGRSAQTGEFLTQQWEAYHDALILAGQGNDYFRRSAYDVNNSLDDNAAKLRTQNTLWAAVLKDLQDGKLDTDNAIDAYNQLQTELGLTNAQMDEMTAQKLDEQLQADADAGAEAADKFAEMADTIRATRDAAAEYNRIVSSADWGATTLEAADTALTGYFDKFFAAGDEAADQAEAYDNLGEALTAASDAGLSWFDTLFSVDSAEGRNARKALRDLGTTLIPDITEAFQNSGGDIETFRKKMAELGERTLQRLQNELGISRDQANALAQQLGLVPENVETMYKLIGDEDARLKLSLLQGTIAALPKDVQAQIAYQVSVGDWQGALATAKNGAQRYLNANGLEVPVDADMSAAYQALRDFAAAVRGARIVAGVAAQFRTTTTGTATTSSATTRGLAATPAAAAAPVVVTTMPSVTIHTAVIGSRYSVQRAVAQALRGYTRINGTRTVAA